MKDETLSFDRKRAHQLATDIFLLDLHRQARADLKQLDITEIALWKLGAIVIGLFLLMSAFVGALYAVFDWIGVPLWLAHI